MTCSRCGRAASNFDVHCSNCGAELRAPSVNEQLTELGLNMNVSMPPIEECEPGHRGRGAGFLLGFVGFVVGAIWEIGRAFIAVCVGGRWEQEYRSEKVIERAVRNSRR